MPDVKLIHGDCLQVMPTLTDKIDAVVADPPYGLGMRTVDGGTNKNTQTKFIEQMQESNWDEKPPSEITFDFLRTLGTVQIIWGGNYFPLPPTRCILVWDKMTYLPTMSRIEIAWTNLDYPAKYIQINSNNRNRVHPTQKPVSLMAWCMDICKIPKDATILDPFMGSGTTGVACVQTGRNFIGIEIDERYYAIAQKRIKDALQQPNLFHGGG